jgi:copper chaperone CopZ
VVPSLGMAKKELLSMYVTATYRVPGMSCEHCKAAVTKELSLVSGVASVAVDPDT